ncbi:hypothetical protein BT96DRAFT_929899 [Gymnopus androsaceus JB14]|uniref:Uncharacterized protein n=1 Tax=Gymnopus androsaceus JB14 TaxID=1447944 RepID=A0A6A4GCQ4_9AGAR|nr:hypothetical protein BT96DRAFT_929899 [Gymnopus androsaceus JB14]
METPVKPSSSSLTIQDSRQKQGFPACSPLSNVPNPGCFIASFGGYGHQLKFVLWPRFFKTDRTSASNGSFYRLSPEASKGFVIRLRRYQDANLL